MTIVTLTVVSSLLLGQSSLDCRALLDQLLAEGSSTWISEGTITALHTRYRNSSLRDQGEIGGLIDRAIEAYKANSAKAQVSSSMQKQMLDAIPFNTRYKWLNEYTATTRETVAYDGERFCWTIDVLNRTDSILPDRDMASNPMCDAFRLEWNQKRVFCWDGQTYTSYFLPINRAVVDAAGRMEHPVNGPLTAGVLAWGQGLLSRPSLLSAQCKAEQISSDSPDLIKLEIRWPSGTYASFVLDRGLRYSPRSAIIETATGLVFSIAYQDYVLVGQRWVPKAIYIRQQDRLTGRLIGYDEWAIESIDPTRPTLAQMQVRFGPDAYVQFISPLPGVNLVYQYHPLVDTERLLGATLEVLAEGPVSCGVAAMRLAAALQGRVLPIIATVCQEQLSIDALLGLARQAGLYCKAVKMDPDALLSLRDCQAILYLPARRHFVVLARADHDTVWIADPSSRLFLHKIDRAGFTAEQWKDHLAILTSTRPIGHIVGQELSAEQAKAAVGAEGYTCTEELQRFDILTCDWVNYICIGRYWIYWDLYGCREAPSGSCMYSLFEARCSSPCLNNPLNPWVCTITGEWTSYFAWACGNEPK